MILTNFRKFIRQCLIENSELTELTPNMASAVLDKRYSDKRAERISSEAVKMVFREFIGKNYPWFMKIRNNNKPHQYQLIDVRWESKQPEGKFKLDYVIKFDFHANDLDSSIGNDSPYPDDKQQFSIVYNVNNDEIIHSDNSDAMAYFYNRAFINIIIKLINIARSIYNKQINSVGKYYSLISRELPGNKTINIGDEIPDGFISYFHASEMGHKYIHPEVKPSRYTVGSFRVFDYSSNDIKYKL